MRLTLKDRVHVAAVMIATNMMPVSSVRSVRANCMALWIRIGFDCYRIKVERKRLLSHINIKLSFEVTQYNYVQTCRNRNPMMSAEKQGKQSKSKTKNADCMETYRNRALKYLVQQISISVFSFYVSKLFFCKQFQYSAYEFYELTILFVISNTFIIAEIDCLDCTEKFTFSQIIAARLGESEPP